jgi:hypothetical protein
MLHDLKQALASARTGHGSYGPNYDGNKLAASIEALIAQLSSSVEEVYQFKKKDVSNWSTESHAFLVALAASAEGGAYDYRTLYTTPSGVFKERAGLDPDMKTVGRNLDDMPQPFAGAIVLLETIAQCGATAFDEMGTPTPNRALCLRFAGELRTEGLARKASPVYQD